MKWRTLDGIKVGNLGRDFLLKSVDGAPSTQPLRYVNDEGGSVMLYFVKQRVKDKDIWHIECVLIGSDGKQQACWREEPVFTGTALTQNIETMLRSV